MALVVLALPRSPAGEQVRETDTFATDSLKTYEVSGEGAWEKGRVTLGKQARLTRKLLPSPTTGLRVQVRLPAGDGSEVVVRFQGEGKQAEMALRVRQGRVLLANRGSWPQELALTTPGRQDAAAGLNCVLECQLHQDLMNAKGWAEPGKEPADWLSTRY